MIIRNVEEFSSLKTGDDFEFNCKQCGCLQHLKFSRATRLKSRFESFLCKKCWSDIQNTKKYGSTEAYNKSRYEKIKTSTKEKYGVDNVFQAEVVKERIKKSNLEKYGVDNQSKLEQVKNKMKKTNLEKYGHTCTLWSSTFREKVEKTFLEKYGTVIPLQNEEIKLKMKQKGTDKIGREKTYQTKLKNNTFGSPHYEYQNELFDSKWELYFFIWAKMKNMNVSRDTPKIEYTYDGKTHSYIPDFIIDNELFEIKGPHLWDGQKLISPYGIDQKLLNEKTKCMKANNVHLVLENEMKEIIKEVDEKYTSDFVPLFKRNLEFPYKNQDLHSVSPENLIRHFHKSIYKASYKGHLSPLSAWQDKNLIEKVALNRLKYIGSCTANDILDGFSVTKTAPKVSVFKPKLAETLIKKYLNEFNEIFDPFSGFSGRMLGTVKCNKTYIGQDINKDHVNESNEIIDFMGLQNCEINQQDILQDVEQTHECLFTCPPYGGKEHWNENNDEVEKSCDEWIEICLQKYECKKYLFVVDKTEKFKDYIVETISHKTQFGTSHERVILIDYEAKLQKNS